MKASCMIGYLAGMINNHGDIEVQVYDQDEHKNIECLSISDDNGNIIIETIIKEIY